MFRGCDSHMVLENKPTVLRPSLNLDIATTLEIMRTNVLSSHYSL